VLKVNVSVPTNATEIITFKWASNQTAGLFPAFVLASIFIIVYAASRAYGYEKSIPAALFLTSLVAMFMGLFGLVGVEVVLTSVLLLIISIIPSLKK